MAIIQSRVTRQGGFVPAIVVDDEYESLVRSHVWSWTGRYFMANAGEWEVSATGRRQRRFVSLHRWLWSVAGMGDAVELDHVNRDTTDNRLCNLRPATRRLNGVNRSFRSKKSGLPQGVYACKKQYRARAYEDGKGKHLGTFPTPEEAAGAYEAYRLARVTRLAKESTDDQ